MIADAAAELPQAVLNEIERAVISFRSSGKRADQINGFLSGWFGSAAIDQPHLKPFREDFLSLAGDECRRGFQMEKFRVPHDQDALSEWKAGFRGPGGRDGDAS